MTQSGTYFGQKGYFMTLMAFASHSRINYSFNFSVNNQRRLDNSYSSNNVSFGVYLQ